MSNFTTTKILVWLDHKLMPAEELANMLGAIAIFLLMLLGVCQIVLRTVFNMPVSGYIDLVELSMAAMAFFGAAYCQRLGAHIRMELIVANLRGRVFWLLESISALLAMGIIGVLIWYSIGHFYRAYTLGDTTMDAEFVVWPSKLIVPIAFSIWFARLSLQLCGSLRLLFDPSQIPLFVVTIKDVHDQAQDEAHDTMGDAATEEGR